MSILFLTGCATGTTTPATKPEALPSHVYPLPLDNVLAQAEQLLIQRGWHVQRSGNILFTDWRGGESQFALAYQAYESGADFKASLVGYRVFGERIDAVYCTLRVERLVATPSSLDFGQKKGGHQVDSTSSRGGGSPTPVHNEEREYNAVANPWFAEDSANQSAATGVPSGMVVSQHERDTALELELQEQIDPPVPAATQHADALALGVVAGALADAGVQAATQKASPVQAAGSEFRPTTLAGIWNGTFTFRGKVTGSFSGEVTLAVDGDSVELDDFCPERGGALTLRGAGASNSVGWQGTFVCPAIRMKSCRAATFTYNFVSATLSDSILTVLAAGTVDPDVTCLDSGGEFSGIGGPLSIAFVAQRADYVHIAVTRINKATTCAWPRDWEDFASSGSMPMPDPPLDDTAYLGIIRTKGSRLGEIQRLLRHCHHVVLLHGQPVLMKLAVTRAGEHKM